MLQGTARRRAKAHGATTLAGFSWPLRGNSRASLYLWSLRSCVCVCVRACVCLVVRVRVCVRNLCPLSSPAQRGQWPHEVLLSSLLLLSPRTPSSGLVKSAAGLQSSHCVLLHTHQGALALARSILSLSLSSLSTLSLSPLLNSKPHSLFSPFRLLCLRLRPLRGFGAVLPPRFLDCRLSWLLLNYHRRLSFTLSSSLSLPLPSPYRVHSSSSASASP